MKIEENKPRSNNFPKFKIELVDDHEYFDFEGQRTRVIIDISSKDRKRLTEILKNSEDNGYFKLVPYTKQKNKKPFKGADFFKNDEVEKRR